MNPTFTLSLIILLIQFLSLVYSTSPNNVHDRIALLAFKSKISDDPHGILSSWNDSFPVCQWYGVTCGSRHPQRVVSLRLVSEDLVGTLSPYVGNLSFLHRLSLGGNSFRGHIPPQIGHLLRLRYLYLDQNTFEGQIPANISRCFNLKGLGLAANHLSGTIPSQLGMLSNLQFLTLQDNFLTGDLLNMIVINMTFLQLLSAATNFFQGSIPNNIGAVLKSLTFFSVGENKISGSIPPSFYNLSHLRVFDLDSNQLQGTLPLDIGLHFPQLTTFSIGNNSFHGNLPASLSNLTQLSLLSVYSNFFTGKLMFSASNIPNLKVFDVSFNYLETGEAGELSFLKTFVNCSHLHHLECSSNNFSGILPNSLGKLPISLVKVSLGDNHIFGRIPLGLFNLSNLQLLNLEDNQFTGDLSPEIGKLTKLQQLSCKNNHLTGIIPNSIGNLTWLSKAALHRNNFHGMIPTSLGECTNLIILSLSENNLNGPLPPDLFSASSMLVNLYLQDNQLEGVIPAEVGQMRNIVEFYLDGNAFSGELPSNLGSCTSLIMLSMAGNFFTGSIPESFKSLTSLIYLDISHNRLSGPIPYFLANRTSLTLNLSFNNFEGELPLTGIFANLSAFRIEGNNKICGGIHELHLPRCPPHTKTESKKRKGRLSVAVTIIIVVASLVVGMSVLSLAYFLLCSRRKNRKTSQGSQLNLKDPFSKLSYDMLLKATDRFSEANLLGAGRFGCVYKGVLDPESNMVVAVKVISLQQKGATKSFMAECEALRNIRHRNLLKIITACSSTDFQGKDFKALVYEFMPNGSLQQWIHSDRHETTTFSLLQRVNIAIDVATAVDYLHNSCQVPVIHCDLKPSNILLDADMVAHVGDFGLARFHSHTAANNSSSVSVKGTVGYAAPEYGLGSSISTEGDTYSYGIVLIEMMTAKTPIDTMFEGGLDLHKHAKSAAFSHQLMNIVDSRLLEDGASVSNENDRTMKCIKSVIEIGVKCSVESPQDRLRIEDAIGELRITRDILLQELRRVGTMYL